MLFRSHHNYYPSLSSLVCGADFSWIIRSKVRHFSICFKCFGFLYLRCQSSLLPIGDACPCLVLMLVGGKVKIVDVPRATTSCPPFHGDRPSVKPPVRLLMKKGNSYCAGECLSTRPGLICVVMSDGRWSRETALPELNASPCPLPPT